MLLGKCKIDSRFPEKWTESPEKLERSGKKVFIPFVKPFQLQDLEISAKGGLWRVRDSFLLRRTFHETHICALHWPGDLRGSTEEFPDSLKVNLTPEQASRSSKKKKAPTTRVTPAVEPKFWIEVFNVFCESSIGETSTALFFNLFG